MDWSKFADALSIENLQLSEHEKLAVKIWKSDGLSDKEITHLLKMLREQQSRFRSRSN